MNGRDFVFFSRAFVGVCTQLSCLQLLPVVGLCLITAIPALAQPESAGVAGQPGQATSLESFNFTELSERERFEDATTRPEPRPALQRSVSTRGPRVAGLPPPTVQAPANPGQQREWAFAPAATVVPSPPTSASFQAVADDATAFAPDTQGAVGPNHLMVTLASQVRVQDRFGGELQTISLRNFWGVSRPTNVYDPRVLYDRAAQRWVATAISNPGTNNSALLIAVSQTPDPTGNWIRRSVRTDLGSAVFPDSPNVGLSRDWITVTANMFDKTNYGYFSCDIWVFNKANLYSGGTGQFTFFRYLNARLAEASVLVPSVNEDNGATNMLVSNYDGNLTTEDGTFGYLRLFSITGSVGAEVFNDFGGPGGTNGNFVGLFIPWESFPPYFDNFAPQKGTGARIYIGDARIQNVVYRDGFLWLCQHVFFPTGLPQRTSVQWLSITPGGATDQVGYLNDTSGIKSYAYPSLAVNSDGDVLIGFSSFSMNQFPSAGYAFHAYTDGSGALRQEGNLKAGEDTLFINDAGVNHWGDWSATVVDPQNDKDFWTIQEYAAAHVGNDSRWGTWWGRVSPEADLALGQTASPSAVPAGNTVTYSVSVTNVGFTTATGARLTDTLPLGAIFVSATATAGACGHTNGVVVCSLGHLPAGASASVTILAQLTQPGSTNTATASGFGIDYDPADNTARVTTTVNPAADLAVLINSSPSPVTVSNTLTYLVTATNRGPSPATSVQLSDTLPPGVTFLSAAAAQGTCSLNNGVVNCNLGGIARGGAVGVTIQVRPLNTVSLTNRASVTSTVPDPGSGNNTTTNVTRPNSAPFMQAISNRSITEDSVLAPIDFTVSDVETPAGSLVLTGSSSNPALVPASNIVFGGSGSARTISIRPLPNTYGNVTITRTVTDADGGSTSLPFQLAITAVNDPPTLSHIVNQSVPKNQPLGPLGFQVDDVESGAISLGVSAASSNPILVPNANISLGGIGSSRTITIRPASNQVGNTTITLNVSDGSATTSDFFVLTVTPANELPTITKFAPRSINEDTSTGPIAFTVGDAETAAGALTVSGSSSNPALVPAANFVFGGSGANRTVTILPATNQFGTATITISATDTNAGVGSEAFVLTVNPVNDPPTVGVVSTWTINEDAGPQDVPLTNITAGAANEFSQAVRFSVTSSNPQLIPQPIVHYTSPSTTGTLSFTPAANSNGTALLTLIANDGAGSNNVTTRQITVTVKPMQDAPSIGRIPNQTIQEDTPTVVPFTLADIDSPLASLSVAGFCSDPTLVPGTNLVFSGSGANRTVKITPAHNRFGTASITIQASDGSTVTSNSFVLTVVPVNDPPTLSSIADRTINEDVATNISFTIDDPETPPTQLFVSASSSNPALVPAVSIGGFAYNRTVNIVPALNQSGTATITVRVADPDGATNSTSFLLTVLPVNDPPTLDPIADRSVLEDSPAQTVPLTGISSGAPNEVQPLTVQAFSSQPLIIPHPVVSYLSPNTNGSLTFTPAANSNGTVAITVQVSDGLATNTRSFNVTVQPVNDPPSLGAIANQTMDEDTTLNIPFYVNDLETDAAQLRLNATSSNEELMDSTGIAFGGSGTNRILRLTPLPDASDSTTIIMLTATDAGGLETSVTFELYVRPVDEPAGLSILLRGTGATREAVLSWPISAGAGWTLQTSPTLGSAAAWSGVATAPVAVNDRYTVTLPRGSANAFFRLRR